MTPEHPDTPTFAAWTHENLVRFATEARGAKIDFDYYVREVEKLVLGMS